MSAPAPATVGSKKALSSFFAKNKTKKTGASAPASGGASAAPNGAAGGGAGAAGAPGSASSTSSTSRSALEMPEYSSLLGDGSASGWLADVPEEAPVPVESIAHNLSKLKMHVSFARARKRGRLLGKLERVVGGAWRARALRAARRRAGARAEPAAV
jgi:hypothetical protein